MRRTSKIFISLLLALVLAGAFFAFGLSASAATPGLSVVLSAGGGVYSEGDTITFECSITNVGDVTISELTAYDTLGVTSPSLGTLYPGESTSFSFSYTVTAYDESAGSVYCSVSAMGMVPGGASYSDSSNTVSVPTGAVQPDGSASVTMSVGVPENGSYFVPGEKIYFDAEIVNTGYVDLENVTVKDSLNEQTDYIGTIPMGDYVNNGFVYTVTEADISKETLQCYCVLKATLPDGSDYGTMSNTISIPLSYGATTQSSTTKPGDTNETKKNDTEDKTEATAATSAKTAASVAPTDAKDRQKAGSSGGIFNNIYLLIAIIAVIVLAVGTVVVVLIIRKKKKDS